MTENGPPDALRRLDAFVGRWRTAGVVRATAEAAAFPFTAVDVYEWMPGGFFLLHHVDARMGDVRLHALEVIGFDPETGTYPMRSYDSQGNEGTHRASVEDGVWRFQGATERFTGRFDPDGDTLRGTWERADDGTAWVGWMDITLTRTS